jgi:hypothetical protein
MKFLTPAPLALFPEIAENRSTEYFLRIHQHWINLRKIEWDFNNHFKWVARSHLVGRPSDIDETEILPAFDGLRWRRLQLGFSEPRPQPVDHPQDASVAEDAANQNSFAGKIEQHQPNEYGQQTLSG